MLTCFLISITCWLATGRYIADLAGFYGNPSSNGHEIHTSHTDHFGDIVGDLQWVRRGLLCWLEIADSVTMRDEVQGERLINAYTKEQGKATDNWQVNTWQMRAQLSTHKFIDREIRQWLEGKQFIVCLPIYILTN